MNYRKKYIKYEYSFERIYYQKYIEIFTLFIKPSTYSQFYQKYINKIFTVFVKNKVLIDK
jgi:hypothetical protein